MENIVNYTLKHNEDRNKLRMTLVKMFSNEIPGTGKDKLASRYRYFVETLQDGKRIYLRRPANFYNGFDFLVCVEDINFNSGGRKRNYPKHEDIINDLKNKKIESMEKSNKLFALIERVYNCQNIDDSEMNIKFKNGYTSELIVKTLKWLFIEQDIRYWNYSGRGMLWKGIRDIK